MFIGILIVFYIQGTTTYKGRIGFEAEMDNTQHLGRKKGIQKATNKSWVLETDSPKNDGFFNIEYISIPKEILAYTAEEKSREIINIAYDILENFENLVKIPTPEIKFNEKPNQIKPQITFQISLKLIPFLINHLYIISNHDALKNLIDKPFWKKLSNVNNLKNSNGLIALTILYINELFIITTRLQPGLKARLPIMSRFSFSKMYHSLEPKEKIEFEEAIKSIFQDQYEKKTIIIYKDYRSPVQDHALILSIKDWIESIKNPSTLHSARLESEVKLLAEEIINQELEATSEPEGLKKPKKSFWKTPLERKRATLIDALEKIKKMPIQNIKTIKDKDPNTGDILSPPPDLGKDISETGMGAGDYFSDLQEEIYGYALVEVRLYGNATTLSSIDHHLTIEKLPNLVEVEQNLIGDLLDILNVRFEKNLMSIKDKEGKAVHSLFVYELFDEKIKQEAENRIRICYNML